MLIQETAFHKTLEKGLVHLKKIIKETLEKSIGYPPQLS
jgi:hypothetical protein